MGNYFRNNDLDPETPSETPEVKNTFVSTKKKKKSRKKVLINLAAILGGGAIVALIGFAGLQQKAENCWKVDVKIEQANGQYFISENQIQKLVQPNGNEIVGQPLKNIQIDKIHSLIASNPAVRDAQVFTTVDGKCVIKVSQRIPIARFFNGDGNSYYIDKDGFVFPSLSGAALKLPLFVGNIDEKLSAGSILEKEKDATWKKKSKLDDMYHLAKYMQKDAFVNAQVDHVYVDGQHNLVIVPRVGDHDIYIGDVNHLERKFKKLKTFYSSVQKTHDINKFKSIHLEYDGQVVCERKLY
ncbi:MAG: hypothetical protein R2809_04430 [Flavobacteriales bacterium]